MYKCNCKSCTTAIMCRSRKTVPIDACEISGVCFKNKCPCSSKSCPKPCRPKCCPTKTKCCQMNNNCCPTKCLPVCNPCCNLCPPGCVDTYKWEPKYIEPEEPDEINIYVRSRVKKPGRIKVKKCKCKTCVTKYED